MRILILAGGASAERDVSLQSGRAVTEALREAGHDITAMDPRDWDVSTLHVDHWDVAIPLVHGTGGEDGVLQRALREIGLPWVGSSPRASELTFDKIRTNTLLQSEGLPVPRNIVVRREESLSEISLRVAELGSKIVVKPPRQGSSIGITLVDSRDDILAAVTHAFEFGDECLIEEYIGGREVTVALLDSIALPPIEVLPVSWYDYESKYSDNRTRYSFDEGQPAAEYAQLAVRSCQLCGVSGIARVDMRIDDGGRPWILEINTIPGMTSHSLVPMAAKQAGMTLADLFESAVASALKREQQEHQSWKTG